MGKNYTIFNMLHDILFNNNEVSDEFKEESEKKEDDCWVPWYGNSSKSSSSRDFNPSESAGKAFRQVFGDDNVER